MLSLSETPVLHGIGLTVTIGVAAAFLLACAFSPRAAPVIFLDAAPVVSLDAARAVSLNEALRE